MPEPVNVLVVAHQTAATPGLLDAVRERSQRGPARFHLVVPRQPHGIHKLVDPQDASDEEAQRVLDVALPKLSEAAAAEVTGSIGDPEPLMAIQDAVNLGGYDEIIISTLPLGRLAVVEARPGVEDARAGASGHARGGAEQGAGRRRGLTVGASLCGRAATTEKSGVIAASGWVETSSR